MNLNEKDGRWESEVYSVNDLTGFYPIFSLSLWSVRVRVRRLAADSIIFSISSDMHTEHRQEFYLISRSVSLKEEK
jgi:hypothetical protein